MAKKKKNKIKGELWEKIKGYPGYQISTIGRVKNKTGRILKPFYNIKQPYDGPRIKLINSQKIRKFLLVKRLVAQHFIGGITGKYVVIIDIEELITPDNLMLSNEPADENTVTEKKPAEIPEIELPSRLIDQINEVVKTRKGLNLKFICDKAGVNYQTVWRAVMHNKGITEKTVITLAQELDMKFILIDKKL